MSELLGRFAQPGLGLGWKLGQLFYWQVNTSLGLVERCCFAVYLTMFTRLTQGKSSSENDQSGTLGGPKVCLNQSCELSLVEAGARVYSCKQRIRRAVYMMPCCSQLSC